MIKQEHLVIIFDNLSFNFLRLLRDLGTLHVFNQFSGNLYDFYYFGFQDILIIPLIGTFKFYKGLVNNIGALTRSGNAVAEYVDEVLTVSMALQVKDIKVSYLLFNIIPVLKYNYTGNIDKTYIHT